MDCSPLLPGRVDRPVKGGATAGGRRGLTNGARHARASAVSVQIEAVGAVLRVAVRAAGASAAGAGSAGFTDGTGLVGLKDGVAAIGGRVFLDSPPAAGTSLRAELTLTAPSTGIDSR
jgi:signal transduction histidine kinase